MKFNDMEKERRHQICVAAGKAVPPEKRSFSTNRALASRAGQIGGSSVPAHKRPFASIPGLAKRAAEKAAATRKAK